MVIMMDTTQFIDEWTAEDFHTYGDWVQKASTYKESKDVFNSMRYDQMIYRMDLVWEKQILPQNIEEYIAIPN